MTKSSEDKQFEQLVHKIDPKSRFLQKWELSGGASTGMTAFSVMRPNGKQKKLVKRGSEELKQPYKLDTHLANEFKLLQILQADGFAVSTPYYLDESGDIFSSPYLVIEYIDGEMILAPSNVDNCIRQMAAQLAEINQYDVSSVDLSFLPSQTDMISTMIAKHAEIGTSVHSVCTREILDTIWPIPQHNAPGLVHGDYWLGNVLWKDGKIAAVLDWEFATLGDPLFDLAYGRLDLLCELGCDVMHKFTANYTALMNHLDFHNLPKWDLWVAFWREIALNEFPKYFGDDDTLKTVRSRHKWFTEQALEKLSL